MSKNHKKCQNVLELTPNFGQNEQGRSMVEMLGVLAVVGVLSIGAISGYRYAMNKYRANQVTNELNLLSHQVAIAMMSKNGVTELKLDEPYETNKKLTSAGYSFEFGCGDGTTPDCTGKYYFNVQDVSEGVCKELVQMSEHMQFLKTRTDTCSAGNNALNFVFELPDGMSGGASGEGDSSSAIEDEEEADTRCPSGQKWNIGGECCPDSTPYWDGTECTTCETDKVFIGGGCVPEGSCRVNSDCGTGEYCYFTACGGDCKTGYEDDLSKDTHHGTCRNAADDLEEQGSAPFKMSKTYMTWWSAKRFCRAIGSELVSLNAYECKHNFCKGGTCDGEWGYCHANSSTAGIATYQPSDRSDVVKAMNNQYGDYYVWTATEYDSCYAYYVYLSNGDVNYRSKDDNNQAVCR